MLSVASPLRFAASPSKALRRMAPLSGKKLASPSAHRLDLNSNRYKSQNAFPELPKLPVAPLEQTLDLFLKNLRHVVPPKDIDDAKKLCEDFARKGGAGEKLHEFLNQRAATSENWLTDWWLKYAYLDLRCPLPLNLSPALSFPLREFANTEEMLDYSAQLVRGLMEYKEKIDRREIKVDMAGKFPMDMSQHELMFGTNRVPLKKTDFLRYGKDNKPSPRHITVIRNGHFFTVDIYDDKGNLLNEEQLMNQLREVLAQSKTPAEHCIGIVSSQERDSWAKTYENLKRNPDNAKHLEEIETSWVVIALDKTATYKDSKINELHRQLLHGGGSKSNAGNRWFDKTLQFCISEDGMSGLTYEHSPAEGPAVAAVMDAAMEYVQSGHKNGSKAPGDFNPPRKLVFNLTPQDVADIKKAGERLDKDVANLEVEMVRFDKFGKNFPKSQRLSPDSFCQLAFQLSYYKMHNCHPPTYETGTLRTFHRGRTDVIRLPNDASVEFVKSMVNPTLSAQAKAEALRKAIAAHKDYTVAACTGNGMDRVFFGWRLAAQDLGMELPALLQHEAYQTLAHFKLSTSQVPSVHDSLMAFGPMYEDTYGVCYNPQEAKMNISVTSWNSCPGTSAFKFAGHLRQSLDEMRTVLSEGAKSKL